MGSAPSSHPVAPRELHLHGLRGIGGVSLIASGAAPEEIAWGVHLAISERIAALAERIGMAAPGPDGGVAKNRGAQGARGPVPDPLPRPDEPQLTGALERRSSPPSVPDGLAPGALLAQDREEAVDLLRVL